MSQSEYTAMAFRAAHGAIDIGSTTSGADGNVSPFALPGGLHTMISGIGVFLSGQVVDLAHRHCSQYRGKTHHRRNSGWQG